MSEPFDVREERGSDRNGIREVHILAFGGDAESRLVDQLRGDGLVIASLVTVDHDQVIGHALFSKLPVQQGSTEIQTAALAPVGVLPTRQNRGIGSALIRRGIDICRERGCAAVLVLGDPDYYMRFGFSPELAQGLETRYAGPAYMALELIPGALKEGGAVRYPAAFAIVE